MHLTRRLRALTLILIMAMTLAACGSEDSVDVNEDIAVDEVLENASERLADTQTIAFRMSIDGTTYIDQAETLRLLNARGTMARPDRVDVEFQIEVAGAPRVSIRMITIGDESWTTDIVTGRWVEAQDEFGYNPGVLYDNQDGIGPVMGRLTEPELLGVEELDDTQAYHVRGVASGEVIAPLTASTMTGDEIVVELWIDTETWDILRLTVDEPDDIGLDDPATWTLNLGNHDEEVTIERPE